MRNSEATPPPPPPEPEKPAETTDGDEKKPDRNERHAAPMDTDPIQKAREESEKSEAKERKPDRNERHAAPMEQAKPVDTCEQPVIVYENADFTGWEAHYSKGDHHFSKYVARGAKNDEASSVKVQTR